jgi:protein-disulfide isomerase
MARFPVLILACLALAAGPAVADDMKLPDRVLGKANAPVTVEEYISLTCPHCAEFYNKSLPELETRYVDTGKVRFILRPLHAGRRILPLYQRAVQKPGKLGIITQY